MLKHTAASLRDIWDVLTAEVRRVFSDKTTIVIFFLATAVYPPLYYYIYHQEVLTAMAVAWWTSRGARSRNASSTR